MFEIAEIIFYVTFGLAVLAFVHRAIRGRSDPGYVFGAGLVRAIGEVTIERAWSLRHVLTVNLLNGRDGKCIGLGIVTRSNLSYHMLPISLTLHQAQTLVTHLQPAIDESQSGESGTG
jgi:hypothetical protein